MYGVQPLESQVFVALACLETDLVNQARHLAHNLRREGFVPTVSHGFGALEQGAVGSTVAINYFNSGDAAEQLCQRIRQAGGYAHAFKAEA